MKRLSMLLISFAFVLSFMACETQSDEKKSAPEDPLEGYTTAVVEYIDSDGVSQGNVTMWPLAQFVDATDQTAINALFGTPLMDDGVTPVDCRKLFAVEVQATDGFSSRGKTPTGSDMSWDIFKQGYLLPTLYNAGIYYPLSVYRQVATDPATTLPKGRLYAKLALTINLFRKIDFLVTHETSGVKRCVTYDTAQYSTTTVYYKNTSGTTSYTVQGIRLIDMITDWVCDEDYSTLYNFKLYAADGFQNNDVTDGTYTWADFQHAYYIPGSVNQEKVVFADQTTPPSDLGDPATFPAQLKKSVKWIIAVEFIDNLSGSPTGSFDSTAAGPSTVGLSTPDYTCEIPQQQ